MESTPPPLPYRKPRCSAPLAEAEPEELLDVPAQDAATKKNINDGNVVFRCIRNAWRRWRGASQPKRSDPENVDDDGKQPSAMEQQPAAKEKKKKRKHSWEETDSDSEDGWWGMSGDDASAPRYRPDSLEALVRSTRMSEDQLKRLYRAFKAECPRGVLNEKEFAHIYARFFPHGASCSPYARYVFHALASPPSYFATWPSVSNRSINSSAASTSSTCNPSQATPATTVASFEELAVVLSALSRASPDDRLRWAFALYDLDGDGRVTRDEMTLVVSAVHALLGYAPTTNNNVAVKEKVEQIFEKLDLDGDGVLTVEEFLIGCRRDSVVQRSLEAFGSIV